MPEKIHKPISQYIIENNGFNPSNPLIVQGDRSLLLEVHNPLFETVRGAISPFAELEKSPEHIHTYRITGTAKIRVKIGHNSVVLLMIDKIVVLVKN